MKIFTGKVVSVKMKDTITVVVERFVSHPVYKKRFKKNKKYQVHTNKEVKIGEVVKFITCKPISKTKRWKVVEEKMLTKKTGKDKKIK